jgi:hypothetical protein
MISNMTASPLRHSIVAMLDGEDGGKWKPRIARIKMWDGGWIRFSNRVNKGDCAEHRVCVYYVVDHFFRRLLPNFTLAKGVAIP